MDTIMGDGVSAMIVADAGMPGADGWMSPCAALNRVFSLAAEPLDGAASTTPADAAIERFGFLVGGWALLCPLQMGREVLLPPVISRIPNAAPWMAGVANIRGAIVPVFDLAIAMGETDPVLSGKYVLVLGEDENSAGLLIDGLPRQRMFAAGDRIKSLPPHPEILRTHILAVYRKDETLWFEMDFASLLAAMGGQIGI